VDQLGSGARYWVRIEPEGMVRSSVIVNYQNHSWKVRGCAAWIFTKNNVIWHKLPWIFKEAQASALAWVGDTFYIKTPRVHSSAKRLQSALPAV